MASAAIAVESLSKLFPAPQSGWRAFLRPFARPSVAALGGVSFEVREGECVGLLGANGAGKTTLLRILATLLLPTRGRAHVGGLDLRRDSAAVRRLLGYHAGSDRGFYARLTGRENLRFFASLQHLSVAEIERRTELLSGHLGLTTALARQVRLLSAGTVQRLSLARALLHSPRVLLLDEPTRSLDALVAADFRRYLRGEVVSKGGATLFFASHSLAEVEELADRVAVLDAGKLLALETPAAFRARSGAATLEEALFRLTGRKNAESSPAAEEP
ncbi:MAG TPA: ABC transporter ATP-binding protein [Methylomirabilota bacterium]|nr:ABC transporter ATP-binding protein [Methylomirabilota bacterium]